MKYYIYVLTLMSALVILGCGKTKCPELDPIVQDYLPLNSKATYISNSNETIVVDYNEFVTEEYEYYYFCKECECGQGAQLLSGDPINDFYFSYHVIDEIYEVDPITYSSPYKKKDFFTFDLYVSSGDSYPNAFGNGFSLKVNFKEGLFVDQYQYDSDYKNFIADTSIDERSYQEVIVWEIDTIEDPYADVWKIIVAKDYGVVKFYTTDNRIWRLDKIE